MIDKFFILEVEQGRSEKTINKYKIDLKQFVSFIELKSDKEIIQLEEPKLNELLRNYVKKMERDNLKPSSINSKIITINKYLRFLNKESRAKVLKIQKKQYINNVITEGEYIRMIEKCEDNYRDKAIITTLANTGIRVSELLSLRVKDIDKETILLKGKQDKYREMFLPNEVRNILKIYIKEHRLQTDKTMLFTGTRGALQRQAINKILIKYAGKCRVKKSKAHPHSLRHFFGKRLAEDKVSLDVIQTYLGHENIATTVIYTKRTKEELKNTLDNKFIG